MLSQVPLLASSNARAIVPVDYTECDRFEQDPALAQPAYPSLAPLRALARLDPEFDEAKFLMVGMTRARNRVAFALKQANGALSDFLAEFDAPVAVSA